MAEEDGLKFEPLCWTYHDGWRWDETKWVQDGVDAQGNPTYKDRSKHFYHRGHCHLFFAGIDVLPQSSKQAYWGKQTYNFHITDEWGPNSDNPGQIQNVRLVGKPIWYFYIEEYWRRMYIQPWDRVDKSCHLPHNQSVVYEKTTLVEYLRSVIDENHGNSSASGIDIDDIGEYGQDMGFDDYWLALRRIAARRIWASLRDLPGLDLDNASDATILGYIRNPPGSQDGTGASSFDYLRDFEEFFSNEIGAYDGFVSEEDALRQFVALKKYALADYKTDSEGYVHVPQSRTEGHVGIKWDASKPCHSLGPFREGGALYFFNTVVNRTMPCEYWIDEEKRTRQYYLKRKEDGVETSGGQTWTFADDKSHWTWVQDVCAEAGTALIDVISTIDPQDNSKDRLVEVADTWKSGNITYTNHRIRNLSSSSSYSFSGCNAKRLKDDHDNLYLGGPDDAWGISPVGEDGNRWRGSNSRIPQNPYDEVAYAAQMRSSQRQDRTSGYYDDTGYHETTVSGTATWTESENAIHWHVGPWQGWYEKDELVKTAFDGRWYRRTWAPAGYDAGSLGEGGNAVQPYWTRMKRQYFPNPPPWLCDGNGEDEITSPTLLHDEETSEYDHETVDPSYYFDEVDGRKKYRDEENRIHLLHWEYAHYYNLVRPHENGTVSNKARHRYTFYIPRENQRTGETYTEVRRIVLIGNDPFPENTEEYEYDKYEYSVIALDWETAFEDGVRETGGVRFAGIDEENECFERWISEVGEEFISCYDDKFVIDADGNEVLNVFYASPNPIYDPTDEKFVPRESLVSISFAEFRQIWTRLTQTQIRQLNLQGDMPARKLDEKDPSKYLPYELGDQESGEDGGIGTGVYPTTDTDGNPLDEYDISFRNAEYAKLVFGRYGVAMPSLLMSEFFPRIDEATRAFNEAAARTKPPTKPHPLSPQDEGNLLEGMIGGLSDPSAMSAMRHFDVIDPYRNGKVNPIEVWKKYFDHREEYTIPETTVVKGDRAIWNTGENSPVVHPRETSYSEEDGARRYYSDDKYVTPIIEYQKIIHLDYQRLPGHEEEERILGNDSVDSGRTWKTDKVEAWGDGFDVTVTIPYAINGEIQSPFSDATKVVRPPNGEQGYCHGVVKPENMMRYHIETYNSLEQVRKYDFISYVDLIHEFQLQFVSDEEKAASEALADATLVEGGFTDPGEAWKKSPYQEDFNDYSNIDSIRDAEYEFNGEKKTWKEWLRAFWNDKKGDIEYNPVVRNRNCYGEEIKYNRFETLKTTGKQLWRDDSFSFLPTIEECGEPIQDDDGRIRYGYRDSNGNFIPGGAVVRWKNPVPENTDGVWVEQCLGAIVKPKCLLILEDGLGYRWKQWVQETALQSTDPLRGSDYDLGG